MIPHELLLPISLLLQGFRIFPFPLFPRVFSGRGRRGFPSLFSLQLPRQKAVQKMNQEKNGSRTKPANINGKLLGRIFLHIAVICCNSLQNTLLRPPSVEPPLSGSLTFMLYLTTVAEHGTENRTTSSWISLSDSLRRDRS